MKEYQVKVYENRIEWYQNGELHREDAPAIEYTSGAKLWYLNGKLHRADGPAIEYAYGDKAWYQNGELYRENGPVIEYANEEYLTEQEFNQRINSCEGKELEIDGKTYILKLK